MNSIIKMSDGYRYILSNTRQTVARSKKYGNAIKESTKGVLFICNESNGYCYLICNQLTKQMPYRLNGE